MFLTKLGNAFFLLTIAMVESQPRSKEASEECCTEKMVGSVSYTLLQSGAFHGQIPHQCPNDCIYTVTGTSSPKFCFQKGSSSFYQKMKRACRIGCCVLIVFMLYSCEP